MPKNELDLFLESWDREAAKTVRLLKALPPTQYDFRPDPKGRSLGELAWHLAEGDAYISVGIAGGKFDFQVKPPDIERPRTVEALAPGYERVHRAAVDRVRKLKPEDLDRSIDFFSGPRTIRELLWESILFHAIHHRAQMTVLIRLAGGEVPGLYGPNREETAARRAASVS
ncbi:MAG TPA: DinB family protein [Vicinamibacterales bacterium]